MNKRLYMSVLALALALTMAACAKGQNSSPAADNGGVNIEEKTEETENLVREETEVPDTEADEAFSSEGLIIEAGVVTGYEGTGKNILIPDDVTEIGENAFWLCEDIERVVIPDGVEKIGDGAFCACTSLLEVDLGNGMKQIGELAFQGCISLQSVTIPDSVTAIGGYAFSGCTSLSDVHFGTGLQEFGVNAFSGCPIEEAWIPEGVADYEYAFDSSTEVMLDTPENRELKAYFEALEDDAIFGKLAENARLHIGRALPGESRLNRDGDIRKLRDSVTGPFFYTGYDKSASEEPQEYRFYTPAIDYGGSVDYELPGYAAVFAASPGSFQDDGTNHYGEFFTGEKRNAVAEKRGVYAITECVGTTDEEYKQNSGETFVMKHLVFRTSFWDWGEDKLEGWYIWECDCTPLVLFGEGFSTRDVEHILYDEDNQMPDPWAHMMAVMVQ